MSAHIHRNRQATWVAALVLGPALGAAVAGTASWPTYRGDAGRSGHGAQALELPLRQAWIHKPSSPPAPAWPPPARRSYWQQLEQIEPRVVDDHTFHPVISGERLLYASSSDDHLHCLQLPSGRVAWRFATDGPLRFAPVVAQDRVYVAGDDATVYCLDVRTGALHWQRSLAAADRRLPGNGRLISAWPVRTGMVVDDNVVYVASGLYPTQGCYLHALDAATGAPRWEQALDQSPQGYLLASGALLFVPTGRSTPIAVRREDGSFSQSLGGLPGSFAIVFDDQLITGRGNAGELEARDRVSGEQIVRYAGRQLAVSPRHSFLLGDDRLACIDRRREAELRRRQNAWRARREALRRALDSDLQPPQSQQALRGELLEITASLDRLSEQLPEVKLWEVTTNGQSAMISLPEIVICGGQDLLELRAAQTGEILQQLPVSGRVLGLAAAGGWLCASNQQGELFVFADARHPPDAPAVPPAAAQAPPGPPPAARHELLDKLLQPGPPRPGLTLVLGAEDLHLLEGLAEQTPWTVVVVERQLSAVRAARERLLARGCYGRRISVHHLPGPQLPFTDYCFNQIIEPANAPPGGAAWIDPAELPRVLRPCGGQFVQQQPYRVTVRGPLQGAGAWTHQFASPENSANSGDERIHARLKLQWFGGPGPARMVDRHLRGPAPLAARGLLIVPGENCVLGLDAYNGTELWQCELPHAQRYSLPYDAGYMALGADRLAVAVGSECWLIDLESGQPRRRLKLPPEAGSAHWGWAAWHADRIIGTAQHPGASRTRPSRQDIDEDYRNHQPLVTSHTLFARHPDRPHGDWAVRDGVLLNTTLTVASDRIFYVTCRNEQMASDPRGRVPLDQLLSADAYLVARDARNGQLVWQQPLEASLLPARNILYLLHHDGWLVLAGSWLDASRDTRYQLSAHRAADGQAVWSAGHLAGKPGGHSHGEQVHHPAIVDGMVLAEPRAYDLATGRQVDPTGGTGSWNLIRPGHSCGTISAAGRCLFFRADNPTLLDLAPGERSANRYLKLSPSRPGCWINIIPACGLVLIPEASAGCVCHYSLQTSMAFLPDP